MDVRSLKTKKGDIRMDMSSFLRKLTLISLDKMRRKKGQGRATTAEIELFRSLPRALLWLGSTRMPQAAYIASLMKKRVTRLRISDLIDSNSRLKYLRDMKLCILFHSPQRGMKSGVTIWSFSDASFNISASQNHIQKGTVAGLLFYANRGKNGHIFHPIDWHSPKQRRVSHSSYGAEILACTEADDRVFHVKQELGTIFTVMKIKHHLKVD